MGQLQRRLDFHDALCAAAGLDRCYFQPTANIRLVYPCVVYSRIPEDAIHADDLKYIKKQGFSVTAIDRDPDSEIAENILDAFPMSRADRNYIADNLNHWALTVYY